MAKAPHTAASEADAPKRKSVGSMVIWVLMALLILGLGGFGVQSYGGGVSHIGQVGERRISVAEYQRALQAEISATSAQIKQNISMQQAVQLGLDAKVRQQLVTQAAISDEADKIGLSVGDARVAREITGIQGFTGVDGKFDRETYRMALQQNNLTERVFETGVRDDVSRALLQGAVTGGFTAPAPMIDALYAYIGERRGLSLLTLSASDLLTPPPSPSDADLKAFYDANIAQFTAPEAKRISYAAIVPEDLAGSMPVKDEDLQKLYDERRADYVQPERRIVDRLVFPDEAAATAAKARLDAGESFEDLVKERGLTLTDIDMGDMARDDLGAAGDAIFALAQPGVVGPFNSDLGPALFRMNTVLAAQETTFTDARTDLAAEYQLGAARNAIAAMIEPVNDALAGGATLEEVAKTMNMTVATIDYSAESKDQMAAYPAFRTAADGLAQGDFLQAVTLGDGGIVVPRLDQIVPSAPIPFDQAKEAVTAAWSADALSKALAARAIEIKSAVEGGASLGSFGIASVTPEIAREGSVEGTPPDFMQTVFSMAEGDVRVIEGPGFTGVVQLTAIKPAVQEGDGPTALKASLAAQVEQALATDALTMYGAAVSTGAGIQMDQNAINAVQAQFR